MVKLIKSIWDDDLAVNDEVRFETFAGNTIQGRVVRFGNDPALVYVQLQGRWREECFGRVSNLDDGGIDRSNNAHWAKPPDPKFTPQEILNRFLLEGGDTHGNDEERSRSPGA